MNRKDVFDCRGDMELDTTYELEKFLEKVFNKFAIETLLEVNTLLDRYPFMGAEWRAAQECQRLIISLLPKDLT